MRELLNKETIKKINENRTEYTIEQLERLAELNKNIVETKRERVLYKDCCKREFDLDYRKISNTYDKETKTIEVEYITKDSNLTLQIKNVKFDLLVQVYVQFAINNTLIRVDVDYKVIRIDDEEIRKIRIDSLNKEYIETFTEDETKFNTLVREKLEMKKMKELMLFKQTLEEEVLKAVKELN